MRSLLRAFALPAIGAGLLLGYAWAGERPRMHVRRYRLALRNGAGAGLRVLLLSDQHFGGDNWVRRSRLAATKQVFARLRPDFIIFAGDFVHNDSGLDAVAEMLAALPPAPLGCYAVLGNHDYTEYSWSQFFGGVGRAFRSAPSARVGAINALAELRAVWVLFIQILRNERLRFARVPIDTQALRSLLEQNGVRLLDNDACPLPGREDLWLAGVDDLIEGEPDLDRALGLAPEGSDIVLLTHNPDLAYGVTDERIVLALSGHTHGGQVVLPVFGAVHTQGTTLPRSHAAGVFDDLPGGAVMVVSRGMGESTPFRFRCPPEIVVIDLLPAGMTAKQSDP